jgi:TolA-binding protein
MTDPTRWSDDNDLAESLEQRLVRSAQSIQMPSVDKQQAWSRIAGALPSAVAEPTLGTATAGSTAGSWLAIGSSKALWVALALSGLALAGYPLVRQAYLRRSQATQSSSTARTTRGSATPTPDLSGAVSAPPSASSALVGDGVTAAGTPSRIDTHPAQAGASDATAGVSQALPASQLSEENRALLQARQALRSNDPAGALSLLEQSQKRFPRGALAEEREALAIEALARLGETTRAAARAQAFSRNYPRSPHAADIRRYLAH